MKSEQELVKKLNHFERRNIEGEAQIIMDWHTQKVAEEVNEILDQLDTKNGLVGDGAIPNTQIWKTENPDYCDWLRHFVLELRQEYNPELLTPREEE